ncbi:hypothetical protein BLA60_22470 [Actinophytocola xinjiangensis]|uniref:Uncharacterized protein n=1 Tax=Actinophytocola xinjiangensis TaxID=485602 RepID=A0A7Z1AXU6_9PSEU|nr:hypothetical protein [Actinophytocola xinjiangensis]OLF08775.1 hypothetical protein BLA60_22470 [Actinophytocola xinjiangensis]
MLSDWWNGVELWMTGLAFPLQFLIVMAVLMPLVLVVAWLIDRIVDHASAWFGPSPVEDRPLGATSPAVDPPATGSDETDDLADEQVPASTRG